MNKVPNTLLILYYEIQVSVLPSKESKNYSSSTCFGAIEWYWVRIKLHAEYIRVFVPS